MRKQIEIKVLIYSAILCLWGVMAVISTTAGTPGYSGLYLKQLIAVLAGAGLLLFLRFFPYKVLQELSPVFYIVSVALLAAVLITGVEVHGGRRWLALGYFYFQPVEAAKAAVIIFTAYILEKRGGSALPALPLIAVAALVLAQPDTGSVMPLIPVYGAMLALSRADTRWMGPAVIALLTAGLVLLLESYLQISADTVLRVRYLMFFLAFTGIAVFLFSEARRLNRTLRWRSFTLLALLIWAAAGTGAAAAHSLRPYQQRRVVAFLVPDMDPLGAGYNTRQSLLAVGSGRITGKGLFGGTQTQLGFLPVRHTDFIFASVAEELGFIGAAGLLTVFFLLLSQFAKIIERTEDYGGRLIGTGIFTLFLTQTAMNIGVTLGLLPVIGIQLPLVSYGGTGTVIFLGLTGIMLNINKRTEVIGG